MDSDTLTHRGGKRKRDRVTIGSGKLSPEVCHCKYRVPAIMKALKLITRCWSPCPRATHEYRKTLRSTEAAHFSKHSTRGTAAGSPVSTPVPMAPAVEAVAPSVAAAVTWCSTPSSNWSPEAPRRKRGVKRRLSMRGAAKTPRKKCRGGIWESRTEPRHSTIMLIARIGILHAQRQKRSLSKGHTLRQVGSKSNGFQCGDRPFSDCTVP